MYSSVNKTFIGKYIGVTSSRAVNNASNNPADGEVFVVDAATKKNILTTASYDYPAICIAQATSATFDVTNEAGTLISGIRKLIFSDAIAATNIDSVVGSYFKGKGEKAVTFSAIAAADCPIGREFVMRIVYKDIKEHPGQFTHTFRATATSTDSDALIAKFKLAINQYPGSRVTAYINTTGSTNDDVLMLVGKPIAECTSSLTDIDSFRMVDFEVFLDYVDNATVPGSYKLVKAATTLSYSTNVTNAAGLTVAAGGSGYAVGDILTVTQTNASGLTLKVLTLSTTAVATVSILTPGQGYRTGTALATTSSGSGTGATITIASTALTTGPVYGSGNWEQVRDYEKAGMTQQFGPTNKIWFPVISPSLRTEQGGAYDTIVIKYRSQFTSIDNDYRHDWNKNATIFVKRDANKSVKAGQLIVATNGIGQVLDTWLGAKTQFGTALDSIIAATN